MIYSTYVGKRLRVYFNAKEAKALTDRFGDITRVNIFADKTTIQIIPNDQGEYVLSTRPDGARLLLANKRFALPHYGRIIISTFSYLADGIYLSIPDVLPEPKLRRRKSPKKPATTVVEARVPATAEDVIADLTRLPVRRDRTEVPLQLDKDPQVVVLYNGATYHLSITPEDLLALTLKQLNQNPNS